MADLETFIQQKIDDIDNQIKAENELLKQRNKAIYDKIEQLKEEQKPLRKLLTDFNNAKNGIIPVKQTRAKRGSKK